MSEAVDLSSFRERVVGRSISEATFEHYARWIRRFEAWGEEYGIRDPGLAEMEDFDTLLADESRTAYPWDNGRGPSPPPAYAYRSREIAASGIKKWLRREYSTRIPETPGDICVGEPEPFDPTYLDHETVEDTIQGADDACDLDGCRAALRLSYNAILRASELVRVRREDVNLDAGTVYVRATKGSQNAEVGVSDQTQMLLQRHMERHPDRERLFRNSYDRAWKPNAWANHVRRHHTEAGSHALGRHSPIMHRLEGGQPFGEVYRRARHSNPSMTVRYARIVGVDVPEWAGDE